MKYPYRHKSILVCLVFLVFSALPLFGQLHDFYMQNGDCYLLIGDGPFRGVYALNNLTGGSTQLLFNRADLDSYGLVAAIRWVLVTNSYTKFLYTFSGADTGWSAVSGMVPRKVVMAPDTGVYAWNVVPAYTVHRFHGAPSNSPTGKGNHPQGTLNYKFSGFDYPCSQIPDAVATMPGYYWVQAGKFYHAFDWPVWSPYTYQCPYSVSLSLRPDGTYTSACTTRMAGPDAFTNEYAKCGCVSRSARGGWVHWILRENIEAKYRDLTLYEYNRSAGVGPTARTALPRVKTAEKATMDKRGECIDGCITQADGITLPGQSTPFLDTGYSSVVDRSYLYSREPTSPLYTLTGVTGTDQLIGDPSNLTAQNLGISSKDSTGNYVYVLGIDEINKWLDAANAPPAMRLASLTDLAVSDQWWQTGGLVYAYDKSKGKVYKFVRHEDTGRASAPEELRVDDISAPESIGADGFGHLYMVKTNFYPLDISTWEADDAYGYAEIPTTIGPKKYRANFRQKVTKSVFKRDYYSGSTSVLPGEVVLGYNEFTRDFGAATPSDPLSWIWIEPGFNQLTPVVNTDYRTELAVINSATPPEVGIASATCDIRGPLVQDPPDTGPLVAATPDGDGKFRDDVFYYFEVENAPLFDLNGVNIGSSGLDKDGDGRIGAFPTTTQEVSVKFYWKIYQVKDRYDAPVSTVILDQETDGTFSTSSLLPINLPGGEYRIGVKARYKYYDYNRMLPGELSDKKNNYLSGLMTAQGEDAAQVSWVTFKVKTVVDPVYPGGRGIIMSGRNLPDGVSYSFRPQSPDDNGTPFCDPNSEPSVIPRFVLREDAARWSFQLRESNYNLATGTDRIAIMTASAPPSPNDPRMEPGTLAWETALRFTWSTVLERNGEGLFSLSQDTATYTIFIDQIRQLFPLPSQPATYSLKVDGSRVYSYWTQFPFPRFVGGTIVTDWVRTKILKNIKITGESWVYVTDETPAKFTHKNIFGPQESPAIFFNCDLLYGTTGETLAGVEAPPTANPPNIEIIVADNNPFGNISGNNYQDPFHTNTMYATHHDLSGRMASFSYTNAAGVIPLVGDTSMADFYSNSGSVTVADLSEVAFKASWVPSASTVYNKSLSYRLFRIQLDSLGHFSKDGITWKANMAKTYANNSTGYQNLEYGFGWAEACGLSTPTYSFGKIIIRDNDRPNAFVKMVEQKHPTLQYYTPSNVDPSLFSDGSWKVFSTGATTEAVHNGIFSWTGANILGFDSSSKLNVAGQIKDILALPQTTEDVAKIEVDVPVLFTPIVSDNVATPTTIITFGVRNNDGTAVSGIPDQPGNDPIRCLFRTSGNYRVILRVQDNALDWPADENTAKNNPTNAPFLRWERELDSSFSVFSSRLDIRVLERSQQGR